MRKNFTCPICHENLEISARADINGLYSCLCYNCSKLVTGNSRLNAYENYVAQIPVQIILNDIREALCSTEK